MIYSTFFRFSEEIEVDEKLMGLALGKKHSNIKEARKIRDIISVELIEGTLRIQIHGKVSRCFPLLNSDLSIF